MEYGGLVVPLIIGAPGIMLKTTLEIRRIGDLRKVCPDIWLSHT